MDIDLDIDMVHYFWLLINIEGINMIYSPGQITIFMIRN